MLQIGNHKHDVVLLFKASDLSGLQFVMFRDKTIFSETLLQFIIKRILLTSSSANFRTASNFSCSTFRKDSYKTKHVMNSKLTFHNVLLNINNQ